MKDIMIKKLYNYRIVLFSYVILIFISFLTSYLLDNKILKNRVSYTLYVDFNYNYKIFDSVNDLFLTLRAISRVTQNDGIKDVIFRMQDNIPPSTNVLVAELNNDSSNYSTKMGRYFYEDFPDFGENIKIWGRLFPKPFTTSILELDNRVGMKVPHIIVQIPIKNPSKVNKVLNILNSSVVELIETRTLRMINEIDELIKMYKIIYKDEDSVSVIIPANLARQELSNFLEKFNKLKMIEYHRNDILENTDTSIFVILPVLTFMIWSIILLLYRLIYEYRKKYFT